MSAKKALWGLLLGLSVLWLATGAILLHEVTVFTLRNVLLQYSGVLGIGVMSVAMILATRARWLEGWLGGLDKMYWLHKWLGISGLSIAVFHYGWAQGVKWLVQAGVLTRKAHHHGGPELEGLEKILRENRGLGETVGEWAFYVMVVLLIIALIRQVPYRIFAWTHTWMCAVFLALVYHTVIMFTFAHWTTPVGAVLLLLLAAGTVSAVIVLLVQFGVIRRATEGRVTGVRPLPESRSVEVTVDLASGWKGHQPGQFAFLTVGKEANAHPFTISSAWADDGKIVFLIKALGDFTSRLSHEIAQGDRVRVEGPYGGFTFDGPARQVWVAGGVGITPFLSRLNHLAAQAAGAPKAADIDLYYCTRLEDRLFEAELSDLAVRAGVRLNIRQEATHGYLDAGHLRREVPDVARASVWFCGPEAFGRNLRRGLKLPGSRFHQELFEFR